MSLNLLGSVLSGYQTAQAKKSGNVFGASFRTRLSTVNQPSSKLDHYQKLRAPSTERSSVTHRVLFHASITETANRDTCVLTKMNYHRVVVD